MEICQRTEEVNTNEEFGREILWRDVDGFFTTRHTFGSKYHQGILRINKHIDACNCGIAVNKSLRIR